MGRQVNIKTIDVEYLREVLEYYSDDGKFVWKTRNSAHPSFNTKWAGKIAGAKKGGKYGNYWKLSIDGVNYSAQRLAWAYTYGEWPIIDIDHIDGNGLNNKISNLRLASRSQNLMNAAIGSNNKSGYRGVSRNKECEKWQANIRINKKRKYLGLFPTKELASAAYDEAAKILFGEYARLT